MKLSELPKWFTERDDFFELIRETARDYFYNIPGASIDFNKDFIICHNTDNEVWFDEYDTKEKIQEFISRFWEDEFSTSEIIFIYSQSESKYLAWKTIVVRRL